MEPKVFLVEGNRSREGEHANCKQCDGNFVRRKTPPQGRPKALFCSRGCARKASKNRENLMCSGCKNVFERAIGRIKKNTSGLNFCSRKCKDTAQRLENGITALHPPHYGTGISNYQDIAYRKYGRKCIDCGLCFEALLNVHHIDGDRNNNLEENLEVLCAQHHAIRHLAWDGERWIYRSSAITPRERLDEVRKLIENLGS